MNQFQSGQSEMMQETPGIFWNALRKTGRYKQMPVPISGMGIFAPIDAASGRPTTSPCARPSSMRSIKKGVSQLADAGAHPVSNTPMEKGMFGYDASLATTCSYTIRQRPRRR